VDVEMRLRGEGKEEGENLSLRLKEMNMKMGCWERPSELNFDGSMSVVCVEHLSIKADNLVL